MPVPPPTGTSTPASPSTAVAPTMRFPSSVCGAWLHRTKPRLLTAMDSGPFTGHDSAFWFASWKVPPSPVTTSPMMLFVRSVQTMCTPSADAMSVTRPPSGTSNVKSVPPSTASSAGGATPASPASPLRRTSLRASIFDASLPLSRFASRTVTSRWLVASDGRLTSFVASPRAWASRPPSAGSGTSVAPISRSQAASEAPTASADAIRRARRCDLTGSSRLAASIRSVLRWSAPA